MPQIPWAPWLSLWGGSDQQLPLSGDVNQWLRIFSPTVTVNGRGEPALEAEIVRDVATYGAQLGPLSEVVLALAENTEPPPDAVTKLREIGEAVEERKVAYRAGATERARRALTDLQQHDPEALATLLNEFAGRTRPKEPPGRLPAQDSP